MAILPISQPARPAQPQRDTRDWHDKVLRSLQIANQVFNIPVSYSDWEKNREETKLAQERTETEKLLRPSKEREQKSKEIGRAHV